MRLFILLIVLIFSGTSARADRLMHDEALARSQQVSDPTYKLSFELNAKDLNYRGSASIQFNLLPNAALIAPDTFIDYSGGTITKLAINGQSLTASEISKIYDGERIHLQIKSLKPGPNVVELEFVHAFDTDGSGFYRSVDPQDGKVYTYTDFEPFYAHRVFPCFDQPDLKATFQPTVTAPADWQIITNTLEQSTSIQGDRKIWNFPVSPKFSTYLFALFAGSYVSWSASPTKTSPVPLRLFARQSLAKYVNSKEWLEITRNGMEFYSKKFGYPFPFPKYDQILVPDYTWGGMENVGAVTFSEEFVHRSAETLNERRDRADVLLHEMAHMWFGDLVTMKWWNDLWLNESFADFMAATALDQATDLGGAWPHFYGSDKKSGYHDDQLVTTHPIEVTINDTDEAASVFDGISYGKGASVLKQLHYSIGDQKFFDGISRYFHRFGFKNTTLADLVGEISAASNLNLEDWQKSWLQTTGVNTIRAEWFCDSDHSKITSFKLIQSGEPLRSHRTQIALLYSDWKTISTLEVPYSNAETSVSSLVGRNCPAVVFPNFEDHDYVKVDLDSESVEAVSKNIGSVADGFFRRMLWGSLWDMVTDAKLPSQNFIEMAIAHLGSEVDTQTLAEISNELISRSGEELTATRLLALPLRSNYEQRLENFFEERFQKSKDQPDLHRTWLNALLSAARSAAVLDELRSLLKEQETTKQLGMDQQWKIVQAIAASGASDGLEWIKNFSAKDTSDDGVLSAISAEAGIPEIATKRKWFARITQSSPNAKENQLPFPQLNEAAKAFHLLDQEELTSEFTNVYFDALVSLSKTQSDDFLNRISAAMFPPACDESVIQKASDFLKSNPAITTSAKKNVRIGIQKAETCIRARSLSKGSGTLGAR